MISVCVPVYNYFISSLAWQLSKQAEKVKEKIEIIFLDDGSYNSISERNRKVEKLPHIKYLIQKNCGRSIVRNRLAKIARGDYIIFIDCDCKIDKKFIFNYINYLSNDVVVGGLTYPEKPQNRYKLLKWKNGVKREVKSSRVRAQNPYKSFLSSNFMVKKSVFQKIEFDTTLTKYGHEDTLFGVELKKREIKIVHINNPVTHMHIDTVKEFLSKTENSIINLIDLFKSNKIEDEIKLIATYNSIVNSPLKRVVALLLKIIHLPVKRALLKGNSSLFLLDIYKLATVNRYFTSQ
ncbi:glycosyltransferase family 2 protein [Marinilabiliaceae bacterium ANBcel2]|nr:glycosyltransferase family 2 protein [Marinilabiliaceae bacterium ANBcel2]